MRKNKLLLLLALLMTAATGAWATDYTTLAVGDVIKVGDTFSPTADGAFNDMGVSSDKTYTLMRADIDNDFNVTEKTDGAYYVFKYVSIMNPYSYIHFGKAFAVTAISDGLEVTKIETEKGYLFYTLALHESAAPAAPKHLITATYREQTRLLEQPLPYATTIGELYEAVSGQSFSDLISSMSSVGMPLTGITSRNTSIVSIGEFNGASTPVTVIADGETIINLIFGSYVQGIPVSATSPLYAYMKDGVKDADKWMVKVGEGQAQALPIGGLKGDGSETVTLQYNGRLKVKGVKAPSEAAAPSVPDGAINGKFSVSDTKQVYFSKGNLRYASGTWSFFDNQYDYYNSYSADAWDKFGWSTSATTYGMNTSTDDNTYSGDFVDWGATMGTGWFTLSRFEWAYLFNTRSASTVNGTENGRYAKAKVNDVMGVILFPDTYTHPDGVTAPTGVNEIGKTGWNGNSYSSADWTKMEAAGCVFLPAADSRNGSTVNGEGTNGYYWSATPNSTDAFCVRFYSSGLYPTEYFSRHNGYSVRLVREVTE